MSQEKHQLNDASARNDLYYLYYEHLAKSLQSEGPNPVQSCL